MGTFVFLGLFLGLRKMKVINSPIASVSQNFWELAKRPQAIAWAKKNSHKRERAQLRKYVVKEVGQYQVDALAAKQEIAMIKRLRIENNLEYSALLKRLQTLPKPGRKSNGRKQCHAKTEDAAFRLEVSIERNSSYAVLASCAA
jgi:hypothetical protein